jgi:hypothetical protein
MLKRNLDAFAEKLSSLRVQLERTEQQVRELCVRDAQYEAEEREWISHVCGWRWSEPNTGTISCTSGLAQIHTSCMKLLFPSQI